MSESSHAEASTQSITLTGRVGLAVLLLVGVASLAGSLLTLEIGAPAKPGPGMWIAAASACGVLLTGVALATPAIARDDVEPFTAKRGLRQLLLAVPAVVLTVPVLDYLGIIITVFLLAVYWLKVPMTLGWIRTLITSAAVTASIYVIFILLLEVPFPKGELTGF